jgi:hypothetical protein
MLYFFQKTKQIANTEHKVDLRAVGEVLAKVRANVHKFT